MTVARPGFEQRAETMPGEAGAAPMASPASEIRKEL
jgi:hypothetical protein